ncbi:MAG: low molecular weight protein-tyrosine phosphatase [Actinomycetota bacterium]|jgi:protein-tyrosine phosphatase|nr:low molecular weight protein-tyrosine phosphatase [Actinomycetota bacterium]
MSVGAGGSPEAFRLLYVCTGNICRSPFAQFHTRFLLGARLGPWAHAFAVHSAGVSAVRGHGMHEDTRALLGSRRDHPDVAAFAARQLPDRDVLLADLVLTMTREHRSTVLGDVPRALPTTFTLREFARLLRSADRSALAALPRPPVARARALVALARDTRGTVPAVPAEEDAVPDPVSGGPEAHAEAARVIDECVRTFLGLVVPPPLRPPGAGYPGPGRPAPGPARPTPPPVGTSFTGPSGGPPAPRSSDDPAGGAPPGPAADRRTERSDDLAPTPGSA